MNTKRLSIGEMSRINHTSINALRLYDKLGILRPAYVVIMILIKTVA